MAHPMGRSQAQASHRNHQVDVAEISPEMRQSHDCAQAAEPRAVEECQRDRRGRRIRVLPPAQSRDSEQRGVAKQVPQIVVVCRNHVYGVAQYRVVEHPYQVGRVGQNHAHKDARGPAVPKPGEQSRRHGGQVEHQGEMGGVAEEAGHEPQEKDEAGKTGRSPPDGHVEERPEAQHQQEQPDGLLGDDRMGCEEMKTKRDEVQKEQSAGRKDSRGGGIGVLPASGQTDEGSHGQETDQAL